MPIYFNINNKSSTYIKNRYFKRVRKTNKINIMGIKRGVVKELVGSRENVPE